MAAAFVAERAKGSNATNTSHVITLSAAPAIGNHLILVLFIGVVSVSTGVVNSITDNATTPNTYQLDNQTSASTTTPGCCVASSKIAVIASMTTITVTLSRTATLTYKVIEVSGLHPTSWFDAGANAQGTATTAQTSPSVTAAAAGEFGVAGFHEIGVAETSCTAGANYTNSGTTRNASPDISVQYRVSGAASGAQTTSATWASAPSTATNTRNCFAFYIPAASLPIPTVNMAIYQGENPQP